MLICYEQVSFSFQYVAKINNFSRRKNRNPFCRWNFFFRRVKILNDYPNFLPFSFTELFQTNSNSLQRKESLNSLFKLSNWIFCCCETKNMFFRKKIDVSVLSEFYVRKPMVFDSFYSPFSGFPLNFLLSSDVFLWNFQSMLVNGMKSFCFVRIKLFHPSGLRHRIIDFLVKLSSMSRLKNCTSVFLNATWTIL